VRDSPDVAKNQLVVSTHSLHGGGGTRGDPTRSGRYRDSFSPTGLSPANGGGGGGHENNRGGPEKK
jgi:hypothetical protein